MTAEVRSGETEDVDPFIIKWHPITLSELLLVQHSEEQTHINSVYLTINVYTQNCVLVKT